MRVIKNERTVYFDVDDTLILAIDASNPKPGVKIDVYDALTKKFIRMIAHEPMVRLLKEEKHRGAFVGVEQRRVRMGS
jgi:hypothetical protein